MKKIFFILFMFSLLNKVYANSDLNAYNFEFQGIDGKLIKLETYKNKVIVVVNVASRCGYTYQYSSLQKLYEDYKDEGFIVLGVPSRDFMQEYSDEADVAEFCSTEYGVDFPMFATSKVRGNKANPLYKKLIAQSGVTPSWNFNKYLISRDGKVVSTFASRVKPDSPELLSQIEKLL